MTKTKSANALKAAGEGGGDSAILGVILVLPSQCGDRPVLCTRPGVSAAPLCLTPPSTAARRCLLLQHVPVVAHVLSL